MKDFMNYLGSIDQLRDTWKKSLKNNLNQILDNIDEDI